jgi:quinol monooxygenase YgiN
MILARIIMDALPEKQKEVMQTLLSMIETAGNEMGCLSYDVFCNIDGKTVFTLIEEWETREDLDHHILSEKFSILLGTKSLLSRPIEMKIHTVSHSEGIEVIDDIRGKRASTKLIKEKL